MLHFLSNTSKGTHADKIEQLISEADTVYIMVAFLKSSGLQKIMPYLAKTKVFKIITGTNFGLTEPVALSTLLTQAEKNNGISAFLNRLDSKQVFHPKMYLFKRGEVGHIIIGSANLTKGGLVDNNECSIYYKCSVTDPMWGDACVFFENCIRPENADLLSKRIIAIYRTFFQKQKLINDQLQQFPDVNTNHFYDLEKLKFHFDQLNKSTIKKELAKKEGRYQEARNVLDKIVARQHSADAFKDMIENLVGKAKVRGLWYSNGMFRGKEEIFKQQRKFRRLILSIKKNLDKSPHKIYEEARVISREIYQLGPNYIGEIMMTYAPDKLANINRNPITVLRKEGGVALKSHSQSFNGSDYEEYNSIVKEISFKLGLKNMLGADYFFNEIYQILKKKKR